MVNFRLKFIFIFKASLIPTCLLSLKISFYSCKETFLPTQKRRTLVGIEKKRKDRLKQTFWEITRNDANILVPFSFFKIKIMIITLSLQQKAKLQINVISFFLSHMKHCSDGSKLHRPCFPNTDHMTIPRFEPLLCSLKTAC